MFKYDRLPHKGNIVHILVDPETMRIACASFRTSTINALKDTKHGLGAHYNVNARIDPNFDSTHCWEWVYIKKCVSPINQYVEVNKPLSIQEAIRFQTYTYKSAALDYVHQHLFKVMKSLTKDMPAQDMTYFLKTEEAKRFLASDMSEPEMYPFVTNYAELEGITPDVASRKIIFMHECTKVRLADIERLRMKYTRLIKNEENLLQITKITQDFDNENEIYSHV
jgi:hypothetical protein